jgi:hypothetical protein
MTARQRWTLVLRAEFSGAALPKALGFFGATIGGATAIGPLAGGALSAAESARAAVTHAARRPGPLI